MNINELTDAQLERLYILAEELGEAIQAIGKVLRHGYSSYNPDDAESDSNKQNLQKELGDVRYAIALLTINGDLNEHSISERVKIKSTKIQPYLHYQKAL